jgi:hypothetical protein
MCYDAGLAIAIFGMPPLLAFTMGSLLQARPGLAGLNTPFFGREGMM